MSSGKINVCRLKTILSPTTKAHKYIEKKLFATEYQLYIGIINELMLYGNFGGPSTIIVK